MLSCDEKSQIQPLTRTQPGLATKRGRAGTAAHDSKRHGTTTLFAALNTLDGGVTSMCQPRHRFVMHFTPTSAAWLNMVERFFREITDKRVRRDSFTSVAELELTIDLYVAHHKIDPKPFIRTARASDILAKVTRATTAHTAAAG